MRKREIRRKKRAPQNVGGWAKRQQARAQSHKSGKRGRKSPMRSFGFGRR